MSLDAYERRLVELAKEISYYLQKSGATPADSADIAQDTLVKLLESHVTLPYDKLRAWMYRVAIRRYIDRYRREKNYFDILQKSFFTEETFVRFDDSSYLPLHEAVSGLPRASASVIDAYYFQDFSVREISRMFGWSESKVKITLHRARKQLRQHLEKAGYTYEDFI